MCFCKDMMYILGRIPVSSVCTADLAFGPHPNRIFTLLAMHQAKKEKKKRAYLAVSQEICIFSPVFPDYGLKSERRARQS